MLRLFSFNNSHHKYILKYILILKYISLFNHCSSIQLCMHIYGHPSLWIDVYRNVCNAIHKMVIKNSPQRYIYLLFLFCDFLVILELNYCLQEIKTIILSSKCYWEIELLNIISKWLHFPSCYAAFPNFLKQR